MKYTALELKSNSAGIDGESLKDLNKHLKKGWRVDQTFGLPDNNASQLIILAKYDDEACCKVAIETETSDPVSVTTA